MNLTMKLLAVATATALSAGCATRAQTGALIGAAVGGVAGSAIGSGTGSVVATVVGAGLGALIGGSIGKLMDKRDQEIVMRSVETIRTETWRSSSGVQMKSEVRELGPDRREVTVTAGEEKETTTVVRKENKWVRE